MNKTTLQLISDLVSEAEKIESKRKALAKEHDQIDQKIIQVQKQKDLSNQLKKSQTTNNEINKSISNKIKTNKPLNQSEQNLFKEWKASKSLFTKLLTSNKNLKAQFGTYSSELYKTTQNKINTEHKSREQDFNKELKNYQTVKNKLEPKTKYDEPIKQIKEQLKKVDLKKLNQDVPDQNILMKLISSLKNYVKQNLNTGLDKLKTSIELAKPINSKKNINKLIERSENITKTPKRKPSGVKR